MKLIKNIIENAVIRYALWKDPSDDRFKRLLEQLDDIEHGGYFYQFISYNYFYDKKICVFKRTIDYPFDGSRVEIVSMQEYIPMMKKLYPKLARQILFRIHLFSK